MSPLFTQHIDPLFLHVFDLLDRINAGDNPSPEKEFRLINDQLRRAEGQLKSYGLSSTVADPGSADSRSQWSPWQLSKYALVAWIDEILLKSDAWPGRDWWQTNNLEWEHFKMAESNEQFFEQANRAANHREGGDAWDDALETYYVCFMLGFRGLYRQQDSETFELATRKYGLPSNRERWASGMADVIRERRNYRLTAAEDHTRDRSIQTAKPLWGPKQVLWPWLLVLLLSGLIAVCWIMFQ